jgi:hypothetical protein
MDLLDKILYGHNSDMPDSYQCSVPLILHTHVHFKYITLLSKCMKMKILNEGPNVSNIHKP